MAKSGILSGEGCVRVSAVARLVGKESRIGAGWAVVFFALQDFAVRLPSSARCVSVLACFGLVFWRRGCIVPRTIFVTGVYRYKDGGESLRGTSGRRFVGLKRGNG